MPFHLLIGLWWLPQDMIRTKTDISVQSTIKVLKMINGWLCIVCVGLLSDITKHCQYAISRLITCDKYLYILPIKYSDGLPFSLVSVIYIQLLLVGFNSNIMHVTLAQRFVMFPKMGTWLCTESIMIMTVHHSTKCLSFGSLLSALSRSWQCRYKLMKA